MGYQELTLGPGYHFMTVTFQDVGTKGYAVSGIDVYQNGEMLSGGITFQGCDENGDYLKLYTYKGNGAWKNGPKTCTDVLKPGEAVMFNNGTGEDVQLRVSGEVVLQPWTGELIPGYNMVGNMTPNTISIQDFKAYDLAGNLLNGAVTIQRCNSDGDYLTLYTFKGESGWKNGPKVSTEVFAPGEAALLNNGTGANIKIQFKAPIE